MKSQSLLLLKSTLRKSCKPFAKLQARSLNRRKSQLTSLLQTCLALTPKKRTSSKKRQVSVRRTKFCRTSLLPTLKQLLRNSRLKKIVKSKNNWTRKFRGQISSKVGATGPVPVSTRASCKPSETKLNRLVRPRSLNLKKKGKIKS